MNFVVEHAEDMFTLANNEVQDGRMLSKVYITYSPCSKYAKTLLKFYKKIGGFRQTLYIGKIYKPDHETEDSLCAMWNAMMGLISKCGERRYILSCVCNYNCFVTPDCATHVVVFQ